MQILDLKFLEFSAKIFYEKKTNLEIFRKHFHEKKNTLLAWRDDHLNGKGWHIPGGIIRFKESIKKRINEVAKNEIGTLVDFYHTEPFEPPTPTFRNTDTI